MVGDFDMNPILYKIFMAWPIVNFWVMKKEGFVSIQSLKSPESAIST